VKSSGLTATRGTEAFIRLVAQRHAPAASENFPYHTKSRHHPQAFGELDHDCRRDGRQGDDACGSSAALILLASRRNIIDTKKEAPGIWRLFCADARVQQYVG
jgi:hypothetical protein